MIHEVIVAEALLTSYVIASYESLLNASAVPSESGCVELDVGAGVIVRLGPALAARCKEPKLIVEKQSCGDVVARVHRAGGAVIAWFSLRRAWTFDGEPEPDACRLFVRDHMGSAWEFMLPNDTTHPRSTLPVSDVNAALAWYPSLFGALGWGDDAQQVSHGVCVDLDTNQWDARLLPATSWPFDSIGIKRPISWMGCTGEVICDDADSFEQIRRRLESIGLLARGSEAFLAVTDPFGHEWYVSLNRSWP